MDYSKVDPNTTAWAAENARQLLNDENERVRSIDAKAGQLAGFAGVILAILGSIAHDAFAEDLGCVGDPVFGAAYFIAAGSLGIAIIWLVLRTLRPRRFVAIGATEIGQYLSDERLLQAKPWALQIRTLRALHDATAWAEKAGEGKADRLKEGAALFAVGLAATLAAVTTLGVGSV